MATTTTKTSSSPSTSSSDALLVKPPVCQVASRESSQEYLTSGNDDVDLPLKVEPARCQSVDLEETCSSINHHPQDNNDCTQEDTTLSLSTEILSSSDDNDPPLVETANFTLQSIFRGIIVAGDSTGKAADQERELVQVERAAVAKAVQAADKIDSSVDHGYKYDYTTKSNEDNNHDETDTTDHHDHDGDQQQQQQQQHSSDSWIEQATYIPTDIVGFSSLLPSVEPTSYQLAQQEQEYQQTTKVYLLGKVYHSDTEYTQRRDDELSLFWFTYRCDFPEIVPYRITSDAGWGCMLRSAQMMLAQALRMHYQSRDYKCHTLSIAQRRRDPFLRSLLTWMADFPSALYSKPSSNAANANNTMTADCGSVYSLHNMVASKLLFHGEQIFVSNSIQWLTI